MSSILQSITLAGGCFWCTEAVFKRVRGVTEVQSGYANGDVAEPTSEQVCSGTTGSFTAKPARNASISQMAARAGIELPISAL